MTTTPNPGHIPDVCHVCGQRAHGVGLSPDRRGNPIRWLCVDCSLILEDIHKIKRMDALSLRARRGGVEHAASLIEEFGTDLSAYTEEQADMLAGAMWDGCSKRLRELVREGVAPW